MCEIKIRFVIGGLWLVMSEVEVIGLIQVIKVEGGIFKFGVIFVNSFVKVWFFFIVEYDLFDVVVRVEVIYFIECGSFIFFKILFVLIFFVVEVNVQDIFKYNVFFL